MSKEDKMTVGSGDWDIRRQTDDFKTSARKKTTAGGKANTLDSDEELEENKSYSINRNDAEAEEEATVDVEDGIVITPFNMREEMQEGHFDADGTYIIDRDKEKKANFHDSWMDDEVDWSKVKETEKLARRRQEAEMKEKVPEEILDKTDIYRQMLTLMKPGESVAKAIRRLGDHGKDSKSRKRPGQSQLWKQKRQKLENKEQSGESGDNEQNMEASNTTSTENCDSSKDDLLRMIGYADSLVSIGDMTIYGDTYEALSYRVKVKDEKSKPALVVDSGFDMFGDEASNETSRDTKVSTTITTPETSKETLVDSEVTWEYKWENESNAQVHGPFTSQQMLDWTNDGYFAEGVYVRKTNATDKQFYSSRRIDFDLYI